MKRAWQLELIALAVLTPSVAFGSSRADVQHAVAMCRALSGPDTSKAQGEAAFWFRAERAESSRKLWSARGKRAIAAALSAASDPVDQACLHPLQAEASASQLSGG